MLMDLTRHYGHNEFLHDNDMSNETEEGLGFYMHRYGSK